MNLPKLGALGALSLTALLMTTTADASLAVLESVTGNVGLSTDGVGIRNGTSGIVSASVPMGSTVLGAWVYGVYSSNNAAPLTFQGNPITYDVNLPNGTACCGIGSRRADVTDIVAPIINGGPGGVYDFTAVEGSNTSQHDGTALVVLFENPLLPTATVGILDGFADVQGDTTTINFAEPLAPGEPGFFAEMFLGIGFSCSNQRSTVTVNGDLLTENAGNFDDGTDPSLPTGCGNGNLITVGSFDDPFSPPLPSYAADTEHYDLVPFIDPGDTSIVVDTFNTSQDDNIFLAAFYTSGVAGVNEQPPGDPSSVPTPAPLMIIGAGLLGVAASRRRGAN